MSETELHIGKLRRVTLPENTTIEQWCKNKCAELNYTRASYHDNWEQVLRENSEDYYFVNDQVWEMYDHIKPEYSDYHLSLMPTGENEFSFSTSFYNGGTCLSEMIEEGLQEKLSN